MTFDRAAARTIAGAFLDATFDTETMPLSIIDDATLESETHWAFVYQSRAFLETSDVSNALVGNGPIFIAKEDGSVSVGGTARSVEEQLADPDRWKTVKWER